MAASKQAVNRRGFLKGAATAAVGAAAVGGAAPSAGTPQQTQGGIRRRRRTGAAADGSADRARRGRGASARRGARRTGRREAGVGPDGPGPEGSRHRMGGRQSRLELRGDPGIDHQLRQSAQREAGVHHRPARGVVGHDGPRLRQGDRQADVRPAARDDRHPARRDVDLPGLLRPGAGAADRGPRPRASSPRTAPTTWPAWCAATPSGTRRPRRSRNRSPPSSAPTTRRSRRRAVRRWS